MLDGVGHDLGNLGTGEVDFGERVQIGAYARPIKILGLVNSEATDANVGFWKRFRFAVDNSRCDDREVRAVPTTSAASSQKS